MIAGDVRWCVWRTIGAVGRVNKYMTKQLRDESVMRRSRWQGWWRQRRQEGDRASHSSRKPAGWYSVADDVKEIEMGLIKR